MVYRWLARGLQLASFVVYVAAGTGVVIGLAIVVWHMNGGSLLSVQTGSMDPGIRPGDAIAAKSISPRQLKVGDIISYRTSSKKIITHRLIAIQDGGWVLTTKGDNLKVSDSPISTAQVVGRASYLLPGAGRVLDALHGWRPILLGVYLPAGYLIIAELVLIIQAYSRVHYRLSPIR